MTTNTSTRSVSKEPNRWAVLAVLGVAQLMVVLDATVVNVALPSAQAALHFSANNRQWVITAYALAFGSLLLLGGKLGDLFGRKWTLIGGLSGFAVASAIGGLAQSFGMLVAARALQGAFGALLAPSALGLLTVTFAGSRDRAKAFGIFSAIAAGGASVGLLIGGALTQAISWRWSLYVNLAIAVPTAIAAMRLVINERDPHRPRLDLPGVSIGSLGLFSLVYGFSNAETSSWSDPVTIVALATSVVLLAGFVVLEQRVEHPLLPLHIVWDRARGGAYATIALAGAAVFAVFLFLTFFLQENLGFSPLTTGLAFLPMTGMIVVTATTVQTRVLPRTGAKPIVATGMALGVLAMLLFSRLTPHASYASHVLPGLLLTGVALGAVFAPAFSTATLGVKRNDAGIASAMVNTSQQVGGSIGTALLSTIFASAAASYASAHSTAAGVASAASVHGYTTAFEWAAALFALGLLVALTILPRSGAVRASTTQADTGASLPSAVRSPAPAAPADVASSTLSLKESQVSNDSQHTSFPATGSISEGAVRAAFAERRQAPGRTSANAAAAQRPPADAANDGPADPRSSAARRPPAANRNAPLRRWAVADLIARAAARRVITDASS